MGVGIYVNAIKELSEEELFLSSLTTHLAITDSLSQRT